MSTTAKVDFTAILYVHAIARREDRIDYAREIATIDAALTSGAAGGGVTFDVVEMGSHAELRRGLLRRPYDVVVVAGHGPTLGLFDASDRGHRLRCAEVFAEQVAACCAPNPCLLLLACGSSWLSPALVSRGVRGVSFDRPLPSAAARAFLGAFFDAVSAGWSLRRAYELGCITMAYDHPESSRAARWFGPEFDPQRGHHYRWMLAFDDREEDRDDVRPSISE